jgi:hypothetical protein
VVPGARPGTAGVGGTRMRRDGLRASSRRCPCTPARCRTRRPRLPLPSRGAATTDVFLVTAGLVYNPLPTLARGCLGTTTTGLPVPPAGRWSGWVPSRGGWLASRWRNTDAQRRSATRPQRRPESLAPRVPPSSRRAPRTRCAGAATARATGGATSRTASIVWEGCTFSNPSSSHLAFAGRVGSIRCPTWTGTGPRAFPA